ncbi:16613_t:CDS:2 [Cetraspora pellucida]|uniref:16613_t:CDS:1 n=1 Tax=Cetraspora pellucida TaxID=1433469 RepID=A0A9N9B9S7_9GLOM|nr:16613_t:CDS:2 [Cetraspora pellucida]
MENQILQQQVDQKHLINLIKYEGLKRMIQRIVGVINKSVDLINKIIENNNDMEVEKITQEEFQKKIPNKTNFVSPFLRIEDELFEKR